MTRSSMRLPLQKTWHPSHGIVFNSSPTPGISRSIATASADGVQNNQLIQSDAEVGNVSAPVKAQKLETQTITNSLKETVSPQTMVNKSPAVSNENILEDPEQNEVHQTTTTFKMPKRLFRIAKQAVPGTRESYWSHTIYRGVVDGKEKKPTVHYCRSLETTQRVLQNYFKDSKVIGFDIEWKPSMKAGTGTTKQHCSLVQIANEERIALFHLALYPTDDLVAPAFKKIMEDSTVSKVGVAIKGDCTRLKKYLGIESQGLFELSHLHKLVHHSKAKDFLKINKVPVSLAKQVQYHLHLPLFKGSVRFSDWSKALDIEQITYAAADSYAAVQLYATMELKRLALRPTPPRPYHAELDKPIRFAEGFEIDTDDEDMEELTDDTEETTESESSSDEESGRKDL